MGSYSRVTWLSVIFFLFLITSFFVYSAVPLLAAGSVISTVVSRVIAQRAFQVAANDAVYLTLVNNTRAAVTKSVASKATSITTNSFFRGTAGALTWAGVGYSAGTIKPDYFNRGDKYVVATTAKPLKDGRYEVSVGNVSYIIDYMPSESNPFVALKTDVDPNYSNTIVASDIGTRGPYWRNLSGGRITYGSAHGVALTYLNNRDWGTSLCSAPNGQKCSYSVTIDKIDISSPTAAPKIYYTLTVGYVSSNDESKSNSYANTTQVYYNSSYVPSGEDGKPTLQPATDKDGFAALDDLKNSELDPDLLAKMMNELLLDASSQPDYAGVPFSPSNPITKSEINKVYPNSGKLNDFDLMYPAQNSPSGNININPPSSKPESPPSGSGGKVEVDWGKYPEAVEPSLESPPTASEILAPLLDLFPFLKDFSTTRKAYACPTVSFNVFSKHTVIDSHCELIEKNKKLIQLISLIIWSFIGLKIVLKS
ncbi:MAG: hypothetical protein RR575_09045 [Acinetobacter sp.]